MDMNIRYLLLVASLLLPGCYQGVLTESTESIAGRELSEIVRPGDESNRRAVSFVARDLFATAATEEALAFGDFVDEPSATRSRLFDVEDHESALGFFVHPQDGPNSHSEGIGLGPVMNQRSCVGCHRNTEVHFQDQDAVADVDGLVRTQPVSRDMDREESINSTPAGRAHRFVAGPGTAAPTTPDEELMLQHTSTFTLFGDFNPGTGAFVGLGPFGGALLHVQAIEGCAPDFMIPPFLDPNMVGDTVRAVGGRAGPPYIGRGLMEGVWWYDIAGLDPDGTKLPVGRDPVDTRDDFAEETSPLEPTSSECSADCIAGRQNQNRPSNAIVGGDNVVRLSRFGLRAAGPTLAQFMVGGSQAQLGLTGALRLTEQSNPLNANNIPCEDMAPDPELTISTLLEQRDMIRMVAPPRPSAGLLGEETAASVELGAALFGVDLEAFRARTDGTGDSALDMDSTVFETRGISTERQLNCVGCHTPILPTGIHPATENSPGVQAPLTNVWAPMFSDLLIHDMGGFPAEMSPSQRAELTEDIPALSGIDRGLADFVVGGQALASPFDWRTPPLMGLGRIGPPLLHDARVFVNPSAPVVYYQHNEDLDDANVAWADRATPIDSMLEAFIAAIELHDLPQPPDFDDDGIPDYDLCPEGASYDVCSRSSEFRSEARFTMEKWHNLTRAEQESVVAFLRSI